MTIRERETLLKINEIVKKLSTPPPTTFAPSSGSTPEKQEKTLYNIYVPPATSTKP